MDIVDSIHQLSIWLRTDGRSNVITLTICILAIAYVLVHMIGRAKAEHHARRAAVRDGLRIAARGYRESVRN
jgi:hypothetical protein